MTQKTNPTPITQTSSPTTLSRSLLYRPENSKNENYTKLKKKKKGKVWLESRKREEGEIFRIIGRDPDSTRRSFCPPSRIVASEIRERFGGSNALKGGRRERRVRVSGLVRRQKLAGRGRERESADMEELPLGVSLAKAVADNGGERAFLEKRLVAWNNGYLMRTGCTGNRWRVTSEKKGNERGPLSLPLCFSRGMPLSLCHPRSANHPLREKSVNEERTRRYERRTGQKGGGGRRDGGRRGGLTRRK